MLNSALTRESWTREEIVHIYKYFSTYYFVYHVKNNCSKQPWIENGEPVAIHTSTWQSGAKGNWRVSRWLTILNTREKIIIPFTRVMSRFFSGLEILVEHRSFYNKLSFFLDTKVTIVINENGTIVRCFRLQINLCRRRPVTLLDE